MAQKRNVIMGGGFTGWGISEGVIRGVFHAFYEAGSTKYKGRCRIKAWALSNFDWHTISIVYVDLMEFEKKFSSTDLRESICFKFIYTKYDLCNNSTIVQQGRVANL